jgi:hypothetical protein
MFFHKNGTGALWVLLAALMLTTGCDQEFKEVNDNPNEPTEVESEFLLRGITRKVSNAMVLESFLTGNIIAQTASKTLRVETETYDWGKKGGFPDTWFPLYEAANDARIMRETAVEEGNQIDEAVALIMEAYIFSILTDAYGDIPYEEALQGDAGEFFPSYTSQEVIYTDEEIGLLAKLQRANTLLSQVSEGSVQGDILFGGDRSMWRKFANSLRLRLLLHAVQAYPEAANEMAEIVGDPGQYPVFDSPMENATLEYLGSEPNQYPLRPPYKTGDFEAVVISQNLDTILTERQDPRLTVYARPTTTSLPDSISNEYSGQPTGFLPDNVPGGENSLLGYRYRNEDGEGSPAGRARGIFMTHAEVEFIKAEAAHEGYIGGDPQTFYDEAIASSMRYYQVSFDDTVVTKTVNSLNDYLSQPRVDLSGLSGQDRLDRITTQKWIALWFHGLEPWFDQRRRDYPNVFVQADRDYIQDQPPKRFPYPGQEQSLNAGNFPPDGSDFNAGMWQLGE